MGLLGFGGGFGVRVWVGNGLSGFDGGCVGGWLLWKNVVMGFWLHSKGLCLMVLGVLGFGFGWLRFWAMVSVLLDRFMGFGV